MKNKCEHADLPPTNVGCPECNKGMLEVARGRYGPIYKCTNKSCNYWLPERPTGEKCMFKRGNTTCGALMVIGTKTIPDRCSDKSCPNRNPHRL
jgi:ssDNA-binding Zn-finger/Zn-ribbon topoisomerase 1